MSGAGHGGAMKAAPGDRGIPRYAALLLGAAEAGLGAASALLLGMLLALVATGAVLRYVFGTGILGAEDAALWLHVAILSVALPLTLRSALAMRLTVLRERMPDRAGRAADVLADAVVLLSGLVILLGGRKVADLVGGISPGLGLPEWIPFALFSAGGGLVVVLVALARVAERRIAGLALAAGIAAALYLAGQGLRVETGMPPSALLAGIAALGLVAGAPLPHTLFAAAYLVLPFGAPLPEPAIVNTAVAGMSKFLLLAVPFFLLAGLFLSASGIATALVRFADTLVGHRRGGVGQTTLVTNLLFAGASGSSIASAAFGASTFQPELVRRGYTPARAAAIVAATSVLDNVIPPSIAILILAGATNLSVGALLLGGLWAGLLMAAALFVAIGLTSAEPARGSAASAGDRWQGALGAVPAFGLGLIVVAGIRFGVVTVTEAASMAALYTLGLALRGGVGIAGLFRLFRQGAIETAAIALLIATAAPAAFLLAVDDVSGAISVLVAGAGPLGVLALSCAILLLAGLVLDIGAALLLFGPLLLPPATQAGLDPITFGVIVVVALMIGGLTPPLGVLVFVTAGITKVPTDALFRAVIPYILALAAALAIICVFAYATAQA
ncbi:tripartite ATP-independent transporter DctM subunit [Palleronia aestuarii]|uniref:Tripartite ATP-independent transporter DctM subunit n=1 Tax=Palleronia aestuarii TaxID=568105 RepID=A0A2W7NG13_9RHOB|nr:TRAP transporter large permease subunit [Palleronia aestuarii]PZX17117.1 tripartite ATP-independent transporter DctM subunit [Palleronia aestuarii]